MILCIFIWSAPKIRSVLDDLGLRNQRFGLVTLHRPANVDDPAQLQQLLSVLQVVTQDVPLYVPAHPRTQDRLDGRGLSPRIHLLDPLSYLDFVCLMAHSAVVFTDSGGVQEETTALGIPCLTLRNNTERPVTISEGTNRLAGTTCESILDAWRDVNANPVQGRVPNLWDGKAAERGVQAIYDALCASHR